MRFNNRQRVLIVCLLVVATLFIGVPQAAGESAVTDRSVWSVPIDAPVEKADQWSDDATSAQLSDLPETDRHVIRESEQGVTPDLSQSGDDDRGDRQPTTIVSRNSSNVSTSGTGDIYVTVAHENGDTADDITGVNVWQNRDWSEPYREYEDTSGNVDNPIYIRDLPAGNEYFVTAYNEDMYVGDVGWIDLNSGEFESRQIDAPDRVDVSVTAYYSDGETPVTDGFVDARTHDGNWWAYDSLDASGSGDLTIQQPSEEVDGQYWELLIYHEGDLVGATDEIQYPTDGDEFDVVSTAQGTGDLSVEISHATQGTPSEITGINVWKDGDWSEPYKKLEDPDGNLDPAQTFENLPAGSEYQVTAYNMDMYVGTTGWVDIEPEDDISREITAPDMVTFTVEATHSDGETPIEEATLAAESHDGITWRSTETDADGEATIWLQEHEEYDSAEYFDVTLSSDAGTECSWRLGYLTGDTTRSCTTDVTPPPGDVQVDVVHDSQERASEVTGVNVWKDDDWSDPYREREDPAGNLDLPETFADLPANAEYEITAYNMDTYVGSTGQFELDSGEFRSDTINAPDYVPVSVQAYHDDGDTALEGATVRVYSHEGTEWRNIQTDDTGEATVALQPHQLDDSSEYYDVTLEYDGETQCSWRLDDLTAGIDRDCTTDVPPPPGQLSVDIAHETQGQASEVTGLVVWQNEDWTDPHRQIEDPSGEVNLPHDIDGLSAYDEYQVSAYNMDMFVGTTDGWTEVEPDTTKSRTIQAPDEVPVSFNVFYSGGEVPIKNATVNIRSHEGTLWRTPVTDHNGTATAWLQQPREEDADEYFDVEVMYDDTVVARDTIQYPQEETRQLTTEVDPPSGEAAVDIVHPDGSQASESNALIVYQDNWSEDPHLKIERYPTVDLPFVFDQLEDGHEYKVVAYSQDMYVNETTWIELSPGDELAKSLQAPGYASLTIEVRDVDGETPIEDAQVSIESHEGTVWRDITTSADGEATVALQPHVLDTPDEYYTVTATFEGEEIGTEQITSLETGEPTRQILAESELAPDAEFQHDPPSPNVEESVLFAATTDADTYEWEFGDGTTETGSRTTHTYDEPGEYRVELTVQTGAGTDTTSSVIAVGDIDTFSYGPSDPTTADRLTFVAPPTPDTPTWSFGDGEKATGEQVRHSFDDPGSYDVIVELDNQQVTQEVEVTEADVEIVTIESSIDGVPLGGLDITEAYEAEVESTEPVEYVEFTLDGETQRVADSDTGSASFSLSELSGDSTLIVTAVTESGERDIAQKRVAVQTPPTWMESLMMISDVEVDQEAERAEMTYAPFELDYYFELPDSIPIDLEQQQFDGAPRLTVEYQFADQVVIFTGEGDIGGDLFGYGVDAEFEIDASVDSQLSLIEVLGAAETSVSFSPGPTLKVDPPYVDPVGVETSVAPGLAGEFAFDDNLAFDQGTVTPGVDIDAGAETAVPRGSVGITSDGELDGSFDVGTEDPNLRGGAGVGGEGWVESGVFEASFEVGPYESDLGGDTAATSGSIQPENLDWSLQSKQGPQPLADVETVDETAGILTATASSQLYPYSTSPADYHRLSDRPLEDSKPTVGEIDGEWVVLWSRQDDAKSVAEGRDIGMRSHADGEWSDTKSLTDDRRHHDDPTLAIGNDGSAIAVWTVLDTVVPEDDIEGPADADEHFEIAYAVRDNDGWSAPQTLTNTTTRQQNPVVTRTDDGWTVAWESIADEQSGVKVMTIGPQGQPGDVTFRADASTPALTTDEQENARLAFVEPKTTESQQVTIARVEDTGLTLEDAYSATDVTDLTLSSAGLVWVDGPAGDPQVLHAADGTVDSLSLRDNTTGVTELSMSTVDDQVILSYRARLADSDTRDLVYRLDRGSGWIHDRRVAGAPDDELILWNSETVLIEDADYFLTSFAVKEPGLDPKNDIILAVNEFAPDHAVDATVESAPAGMTTELEYTVRNIGDVKASQPIDVRISNGTEVIATNEHGPLSAGESVSDTVAVEVDSSGTFTVSIDDTAEPTTLDSEATTVEVTAATPSLSITDVEGTQATDGVNVSVTVANDGGAASQSMPIELTNGNHVMATESLPAVGPNSQQTVSMPIDTSSLNQSVPDAIILDPNQEHADEVISERSKSVWVARPAIEISDITYYDTGGTTADVLLANRGPAPANITLTVRRDTGSDILGTTTTTIEPMTSEGAVYKSVHIPLDDVQPDTDISITADTTVPDSTPEDTAVTESVSPIFDGTPVEMAADLDVTQATTSAPVTLRVSDDTGNADNVTVELPEQGTVRDLKPVGDEAWQVVVEFDTHTWQGGKHGGYEEVPIHVTGHTESGITDTTIVSVPVHLSGDITGDGEVAIRDFRTLAVAYEAESGDPDYNEEADLINNGEVGLQDLAIMSRYWGETAWGGEN